MSVRLMAAVFDLEISSTEKLVLLAMADHARDDGTGCYPSIELLARKTSQSRRGVQKIMRRLEEERGLIAPSQISRGRRSTEYKITLENREPRSLFARPSNREPGSSVQRIPFAPTANASASNREPGSPEPLRTVIETSEGTSEQAAQGAASSARRSNSQPKTLSSSQARYSQTRTLINEAEKIIVADSDAGRTSDVADLRELLKWVAARKGFDYDGQMVTNAADIALRRKSESARDPEIRRAAASAGGGAR